LLARSDCSFGADTLTPLGGFSDPGPFQSGGGSTSTKLWHFGQSRILPMAPASRTANRA
jgi:hypothetical protein